MNFLIAIESSAVISTIFKSISFGVNFLEWYLNSAASSPGEVKQIT